MFRIITISREYGSGGGVVGETLARQLGWRLVDRSVVSEVARRANVDPSVAARFDEAVDPWFHHLVKALWRGGYEGVASRVETEAPDVQTLAAVTGEILLEAAALGQCVIVGRGGQCLLRDREDAFHACVYGPREQKIQRLRERLAPGMDVGECLEHIDRQRAAYIQRTFGEDWRDRRLYHLMISSVLGLETTAATILRAAGLTPRDS
jgi:Cytidylate kinase-like family